MTAPTCYTVRAACETLSVSKATMFRLLRTGQIAQTKCGARTLIRDSELKRYVAANTAKGDA